MSSHGALPTSVGRSRGGQHVDSGGSSGFFFRGRFFRHAISKRSCGHSFEHFFFAKSLRHTWGVPTRKKETITAKPVWPRSVWPNSITTAGLSRIGLSRSLEGAPWWEKDIRRRQGIASLGRWPVRERRYPDAAAWVSVSELFTRFADAGSAILLTQVALEHIDTRCVGFCSGRRVCTVTNETPPYANFSNSGVP